MKLTRIRLINWHIFKNETITINKNTLITGENGNGKSTLIDAVFFVLSSGDDKNFNSATDGKSARNLMAYLRGKIGSEGQEYLRNQQDIIGHVALEFYDKEEKQYYLVGATLEVANNANKPKVKFYIIEKCNFYRINYVDNSDAIANFKSIESQCKNKNIIFTRLQDNLTHRRSTIAKFFELKNGRKYFDLLKKALAFKVIDKEVSTFVNDFLLNEDNINVDILKEELRSYKEIQHTIRKQEDQLKQLSEFVGKIEKYIENKKEISYLELLEIKEEIESLQNRIANAKSKLIAIHHEQKENNVELNTLETKLTANQKELYSLEDNDILKAIRINKDRLEKLESDLEKYINQQKSTELIINDEIEIAKVLNIKSELKLAFNSKDNVRLNKAVSNYVIEREVVFRDSIGQMNESNFKMKSVDQEICEINLEIESINRGVNKYDYSIISLIDLIKSNIFDDRGNAIDVMPLCECIEITDSKWTDAIEGYLNFQRFNLVVDGRYYDQVVKLYDKNKHKNNINRVGVINTAHNKSYSVDSNSLYQKIKVINPVVDTYCRFLLGRVICVENVLELKNYATAITKTCSVYKSLTLRGLNPHVYAKPYIGRTSMITRKERLKCDLIELNLQKNNLNSIIKRCNNIQAYYSKSKLREANFEDFWTLQNSVRAEITEVQKQIKKHEDNKDFIYIQESIAQLEDKISYINNQIKEKNNRNKTLSKSEWDNEKTIENSEKALNEAKAKDIDKVKEITDTADYEMFAGKIKEKNSQIYSLIDSRKTQNIKLIKQINPYVIQYINNYNINLSYDEDSWVDFIAEYNKIRNYEIISVKAKADRAYQNALQGFNENFISKLREKINDAKDELQNINKNLKNHPFGSDKEIYQFVYKASSDQEMWDYYRIITSGKEVYQKDLMTETLDSRDHDIIQKLFAKIASDANNTATERAMKKYLDYRAYLTYDIKITNKNGEVSYISKIIGGRSGGEKQTPFYVIMGSCFAELIDKKSKKSSACIVAFDEAFDKMDETRTITLMNFFNELNIQLLISVPTVRAHALIPHVDEAIEIIKTNNTVQIASLTNG